MSFGFIIASARDYCPKQINRSPGPHIVVAISKVSAIPTASIITSASSPLVIF